MSTIKLTPGAQSGFASLMTTELNSIVTGNAIIGSTAIANATNLDLEIEFSFTTGGSVTGTGSPFVGVFLVPLNGDGSTYGDGRFGSSAAGPPPGQYLAGYIGVNPAAVTQTGAAGLPFIGTKILLPNGSFKPILWNQIGNTLTSSGNILYYRTTNRSVA